ncbi:class I SAM-dependent methyltransferase [Azospirillum argentinense]
MLGTELMELSYPDFIARLGHENLPPGGDATISEWILQSRLDKHSQVLDLACSTGYATRRVEQWTAACCVGLDISQAAIKSALALTTSQNAGVAFLVGDAAALPFKNSAFTHVLAGCNFAFIQPRWRALGECARVLARGGMLVAADFFYHNPPEEALLTAVADAIGFRPSPDWTESYWMDFYSSVFKQCHCRVQPLEVLANDLVLSVIDQHFDTLFSGVMQEKPNVRELAVERFKITRLLLNEHRAYQSLLVSIWRRE